VSLIGKYAFESRSRSGCSNSYYQLCRTECCGRFGVEDDELLDFYFDPADLSRHIFIGQDVSCPFCGKQDWDFVEIETFAEMPAEWRWAAPLDLRRSI
jgi:hypothetical protein